MDLIFFVRNEKPGTGLKQPCTNMSELIWGEMLLNHIKSKRQIRDPMRFIQRLGK
ncbi:hypothetical protein D3C85_1025410 [compost metagenome]